MSELKRIVTMRQVKRSWKKTGSVKSLRDYIRTEFSKNNPFIELSPKLLEILV